MLDFTFFLWKYSAMVQNNMQATFIQIRPMPPMAQVWHNCLQVNRLQVTGYFKSHLIDLCAKF